MEIPKHSFNSSDLYDYISAALVMLCAHITVNKMIGIVSLLYICLKTFYLIRNNRKGGLQKHE
jgi:hypothetical protein